jgi:hypothetical protein
LASICGSLEASPGQHPGGVPPRAKHGPQPRPRPRPRPPAPRHPTPPPSRPVLPCHAPPALQALDHGQLHIASALLAAGAEVVAPARDGHRPADRAREPGLSGVLRAAQRYGPIVRPSPFPLQLPAVAPAVPLADAAGAPAAAAPAPAAAAALPLSVGRGAPGLGGSVADAATSQAAVAAAAAAPEPLPFGMESVEGPLLGSPVAVRLAEDAGEWRPGAFGGGLGGVRAAYASAALCPCKPPNAFHPGSAAPLPTITLPGDLRSDLEHLYSLGLHTRQPSWTLPAAPDGGVGVPGDSSGGADVSGDGSGSAGSAGASLEATVGVRPAARLSLAKRKPGYQAAVAGAAEPAPAARGSLAAAGHPSLAADEALLAQIRQALESGSGSGSFGGGASLGGSPARGQGQEPPAGPGASAPALDADWSFFREPVSAREAEADAPAVSASAAAAVPSADVAAAPSADVAAARAAVDVAAAAVAPADPVTPRSASRKDHKGRKDHSPEPGASALTPPARSLAALRPRTPLSSGVKGKAVRVPVALEDDAAAPSDAGVAAGKGAARRAVPGSERGSARPAWNLGPGWHG